MDITGDGAVVETGEGVTGSGGFLVGLGKPLLIHTGRISQVK
jgi:hypothetical protein